MPKLIVKNISKTQRGVFAGQDFKKGEIIEVCPVVLVPKSQERHLDKTKLIQYYFVWGSRNQPAIALGYGSLYNHSFRPNIEYDEKVKQRVIVFRALRDIKKGEELRSNYNGDPESQEALWFKPDKKSDKKRVKKSGRSASKKPRK